MHLKDWLTVLIFVFQDWNFVVECLLKGPFILKNTSRFSDCCLATKRVICMQRWWISHISVEYRFLKCSVFCYFCHDSNFLKVSDILDLSVRGTMKNLVKEFDKMVYTIPGKWDLTIANNFNVIHIFLIF